MEGEDVQMTNLGKKNGPKDRHRNWAQMQTRETDLFSTLSFNPKRET